MGRYYSGDIKGKFWFAVQSSDDAEFFGGTSWEPNYITYHFTAEDLPGVEEGIATCLEKLGGYAPKLDQFFLDNPSYTDEKLSEYLGLATEDKETGRVAAVPVLRELLEWYARRELGEKIRNCLEETGECTFEAEL